MFDIQVVPNSSEGCGLCAMGSDPCPYHADGGRTLLELRGPRITLTRKYRVTANGQDIGWWEKLGDREWEAHLDDGPVLTSDRFYGLEFEILKAIAAESSDEHLRAAWEHYAAAPQRGAAKEVC